MLFILTLCILLLFILLNIVDFENKSVQFTMKLVILLGFQYLQGVNQILKMAASIGLLELRF